MEGATDPMMSEQNQHSVQHLAEWLSERRWYGEKARSLTTVQPVFRARTSEGGHAAEIEIAQLGFAHGTDASYLLFRAASEPGEDGIESREFRDWLLAGFVEGRVLQGETGARLQWNLMARPDEIPTGDDASSRVFRGEQSNTSIVYGDRVILKVFRKIREGVNPEVEIGEFLTRNTSFQAFPRLMGTIELQAAGEVTTVAAAQAYIPSVGDAWAWITGRINDPGVRPATVEAAKVLGARTGEMHVAFASGKEDAFAPEVAPGAYAEAVASEARLELRDTIDQLEARGVAGASQLGGALDTSLDSLRSLEGTLITRIHGDYHLGQVLRTSDEDFAILDFEGEPTRSLAERRAKASPLRDVAGMLRSFDYAAETARRSAGGVESNDIDEWYTAARASYLDGYDEVVRHSSSLMQGWRAGGRDAVLAAFEIHKALYEVRYELGNRPDWLGIPLNALRRIGNLAPND